MAGDVGCALVQWPLAVFFVSVFFVSVFITGVFITILVYRLLRPMRNEY